MSDFKKYPDEAAEVRALVDRRRHFLNVIYAMAILATFQLCTSVGWYTYINEAYYHMADNTEHFMHMLGIFGQFLAICMLYIAIYVRRSALPVFLILFYFAAAAVKLLQISYMYPDIKHRHKFFALTRHSEYDAISMIYDSVIFVSSMVNALLSLAATWHFTPLVIVKMDFKNVKKEAEKSMKKMFKPRSATCHVITSTSTDCMEISDENSGHSFKSKVARKRTTKATINGKAQVQVINQSTHKEVGGVFKNGKQITSAPPVKNNNIR